MTFSMSDANTQFLPTFDAPAGGLTPSMRQAFDETGVILLRDFCTVSACEQLRARALELVDAFDPGEVRSIFSTTEQTQLDDDYFLTSGDKIRFFLEADAFGADGALRQAKHDSLNKIGHAMHDLDPTFDAFSRTPELAAVVDSLGYEDPVIIQSMYIFKPPHIGGEVVCHQDSTFLYTEPESCIGFWFALEDATLDNGCMHFIPGAHREPLKARSRRRPEGGSTIETLDDSPWAGTPLPAPAPAGTLVIFHGRAPHMSGVNHSGTSRHAYTLHVIDRSCRYPAENWLQRSPDLPLRGFGAR